MGNSETTPAAKLDVIAKIQPGWTVNVNSMTLVDHSTWGAAISRRWNSESRLQTINWIDDTVSQAITSLTKTWEPELWTSLRTARGGIVHLANTYKDDKASAGRLQGVIGRIDQLETERTETGGTSQDQKDEVKTGEKSLETAPAANSALVGPGPDSSGESQTSGESSTNPHPPPVSPSVEDGTNPRPEDTPPGTIKLLAEPGPANYKQLHDVAPPTVECKKDAPAPDSVVYIQPVAVKPVTYRDVLLHNDKKNTAPVPIPTRVFGRCHSPGRMPAYGRSPLVSLIHSNTPPGLYSAMYRLQQGQGSSLRSTA